jgi:excisionase family DNA binding protein
MPHFSLREAAGQVGISKSTIHRAVKAGRISATQEADGSLRIEASELFRVFPPVSGDAALTRTTTHVMGQTATHNETGIEAAALKAQLAALEAQVSALKELTAEYRNQRDAWQQQAERLALSHNAASPRSASLWQRLVG